jgi:hypothetical protein
VLDINEGPVDAVLTVTRTPTENVLPTNGNQVVGTLTSRDTDAMTPADISDAAKNLKFSVVSPANLFAIGGSQTCVAATPSGQSCTVSLMQTGALDFEASTPAGQQVVTLRVEDSFGQWNTFDVKVPVINVNEPPTGVVFTPDAVPTIEEGVAVNTLITTATAIDPDVSDTQTFTLISSGGGAVKLGAPSRRRASSIALLVADSTKFDFETSPSIAFSLRVTDSTGASFTVTSAITVRDKPMVVSSSVSSISEAAVVDTQRVAMLTLENYDTVDTPTFFMASLSMDSVANNNNFFKVLPIAGQPTKAGLYLTRALDYDQGLRTLVASIGVSFASNRTPVNTRLTYDVTNVK